MQYSLFVTLKEKYKVRNIANLIARGHTNADLYSCNLRGRNIVLKVGHDRRSREGVMENIYGYRQLSRIGAASIVPEKLKLLKVGDNKILMMELLQNNFKGEAAKKSPHIYRQLTQSIRALTLSTLASRPGVQAKAIGELKSNLRSSYRKLISAGMLSRSDANMVEEIGERGMVTDKCCLFILDFTPDNVFLKSGGIKVIDPWRQKTYLGSLIPSLSMFYSQLFDIYRLGNTKKHAKYFGSAVSYVGSKLHLNNMQIEKQEFLGKALQYALSSHVRVKSDPAMARRYAKTSIDMLTRAS